MKHDISKLACLYVLFHFKYLLSLVRTQNGRVYLIHKLFFRINRQEMMFHIRLATHFLLNFLLCGTHGCPFKILSLLQIKCSPNSIVHVVSFINFGDILVVYINEYI